MALLTVNVEVLMMLPDVPAEGVYSWHDRSFVVVYLDRFSVRFLHRLNPVKMKSFWGSVVALSAAWETKFDRFSINRVSFGGTRRMPVGVTSVASS
jgi:hypothetical protein